MKPFILSHLFNFDMLALVMIGLITFIGLTVASFASRYLIGDIYYKRFFRQLLLLIISLVMMVSADNVFVLISMYLSSNYLLTKLMTHKKRWRAAEESGKLTLKYFMLGFICISIGFALLSYESKSSSLHQIVSSQHQPIFILPSLLLIIVGAAIQSGIWPFHKWLISSLNSPTPVSAIMHAGLVNGGGFLLARLSPLLLKTPIMLDVIFLIGFVSAILGTLWKLLQSDVKRMLACSTMSQMGFMLMQCGLGLFSAAVAHLCWHGMYKSYLFLASGSAVQEVRIDVNHPPKMLPFILALICGLFGSYCFAFMSDKVWMANDTSIIPTLIAFIAGSQFAIVMIQGSSLIIFPIALFSTSIVGGLYGVNVNLIESILTPMGLMQPQPLSIVHLFAIILMILAWLGILFNRTKIQQGKLPCWAIKIYVLALNASQPHPKTITAQHNNYKYL